ncbi:MAG: NADH:ubiquinone oxidoreductase [Acidobacteriota bacterium]
MFREHTKVDKPLLSMYWAASCGGCEISLLNLHEKILEIDAHFDLVFCPCLVDTKKAGVEALPDRGIAVTLFNGAVRTEENREMARLLRHKSQVLVAYGSCAYEGCMPALSNLSTASEHMRTIYIESPSLDNPTRATPAPGTPVAEGELRLPEFFDRVQTLEQVTDVDYFIPGCPPEPRQLSNVVDLLLRGAPLPPKGSVLGAGRSTVCDECTRKKQDKIIGGFHRTFELIPDPDQCLLEQGLICMGIATRDGCGGLCPKVNMPCTGCYGAPEGVQDQGAKMVASLGSILDLGRAKGGPSGQDRIDAILDAIPDCAGTFYKYSLAHSILKGKMG